MAPPNKFSEQAQQSAQAADQLLDSQLEQLKALTGEQIDNLRIKVSDQELYDRLVAVVQDATQRNLSLAQLLGNIKSLGGEAISLAKEVLSIG